MKILQQHVELVPSKLCDLLNITIILLKVVTKNLVQGKNWFGRTKIGSQNWSSHAKNGPYACVLRSRIAIVEAQFATDDISKM